MASAASTSSTGLSSTQTSRSNTAGQQFVKEYTEQGGRIPSFVENYCFITPYIIKAAIEKAAVVDRVKFREALSSLKMIEPTLGVPVKFDKNAARKEYMYMMEI